MKKIINGRKWEKITEEFLDERFLILQMEGEPRPSDVAYYEGAIAAVERLGYWWKRTDGKHVIGKAN